VDENTQQLATIERDAIKLKDLDNCKKQKMEAMVQATETENQLRKVPYGFKLIPLSLKAEA
jgi:hypothetical protein